MISAEFLPALDIVTKVTLILGVTALLSRVLARRSAAVRHQVWAVGILASLMLPVVSSVAPHWTVAILPAAPETSVVAPAPTRVNEPAPTPVNLADEVSPVAPTTGLMPEPARREAPGDLPAALNGASSRAAAFSAGGCSGRRCHRPGSRRCQAGPCR